MEPNIQSPLESRDSWGLLYLLDAKGCIVAWVMLNDFSSLITYVLIRDSLIRTSDEQNFIVSMSFNHDCNFQMGKYICEQCWWFYSSIGYSDKIHVKAVQLMCSKLCTCSHKTLQVPTHIYRLPALRNTLMPTVFFESCRPRAANVFLGRRQALSRP